MSTKSIHEFSELLSNAGIETSDMGCVMLPVEPFNIFGNGRENILLPEDLYVSQDPKKKYVNGDVSEKAHITLLYGLLSKAYLIKDLVDGVLEGWDCPEYFIPESIGIFESKDKDEPGYAAIVVEIEDQHLVEAHQRLSYLPHINTFPDYRAHMTLAYVKLEEAQKWKDVLEQEAFHIYVKEGLDYGDDDVTAE